MYSYIINIYVSVPGCTNYLNLNVRIIRIVFLSEDVYFCPLVVVLRYVFTIGMTPVIKLWKCSNL